MKLAVPQRNEHVSAFKQYNDALPAEHTALWTEQVEAWEADSTQPNPFLVTRPSTCGSLVSGFTLTVHSNHGIFHSQEAPRGGC